MRHVLIIGHSFVRRMIRNGTMFGLDESRSVVHFCGFLGSRPLNLISQLARQIDWVISTYGLPDVVVFLLGSNDLLNDYSVPPTTLAWRLISIAAEFRRRGTTQVLFTEVLPRYGTPAFRQAPQFFWTPGVSTVKDAERAFYARAYHFNLALNAYARFKSAYTFVRWKGLHLALKNHLEDGLHLTYSGRLRMAATLRRVLIVALC